MSFVLLQSAAEQGQSDFLGWPMLAWAVLPFLLMIWLGRRRKKVEPDPPHLTDATFEDLVLRAETPVLVHFYRSWSIGDRVMVNMAKRIAKRFEGRSDVFWLDVDANPDTVARYPNLGTPAFVFFIGGKRVVHAEGVVDEGDVVQEIAEAEEAYRRRLNRPADVLPEG